MKSFKDYAIGKKLLDEKEIERLEYKQQLKEVESSTEIITPKKEVVETPTEIIENLEEEIHSSIENPSAASIQERIVYLKEVKGIDGKDGKDGKNGVDGRDGRDGKNGREITIKNNDGIIDYSYGDDGWKHIFSLKSLKGDRGEKGEKGDIGKTGERGPAGIKGEDGKDGNDGKNAKQIELLRDGNLIQWKYNGEGKANTLFSLRELSQGETRVIGGGGITSTTWGKVGGNLADQKDLVMFFNAKQNKPAVSIENNIAVFDANKNTIDSEKSFTYSLSDTPSDNKIPTEKTVKDEFDFTNNTLFNELSNGVKTGFTITINGTDNRTINISSGTGIIVDNSNPAAPILTPVVFPGVTGLSLTNLGVSIITYLAVNADGNIIQQATDFTCVQRRTYIILGAAIHSDKTIVNAINNMPEVALNSISQLNDLMAGLRNFNITGNVISPNGANLTINKSSGSLFKKGSNFYNNALAPHVISLAPLVAPTNIRYRLQNGIEYANTNVVDTGHYDLNGVLTVVLPNKYTIQRFALFSSNLIRVQYGQAVYGSKAEAIQAISTEVFVEEQNISTNGLLRGLLVIKSGATALNNILDAQFFEADRFGSTKFGSSGTPTTTMQQAYDNSLKPQITTSDLGALQIKRGTSLDSDPIQEFLDGAGTVRASISGDGSAVFGNKAAGNYSGFEPDGTYKMTGESSVFDDISLSGLSFSAAGGAAPDPIDFINSNIKTYGFDGDNIVERLYITTEMHHDYKEGSNIELHMHWTPTTATTGNVKWQVYYTWQKIDGTYSAPTLLSVVSAARGTAWQNTYSSFGTVSGLGQTINSQLLIQIFRDPTDVSDTYTSDAAFIAFGIHYEKDTLGSRNILSK